MPTGLLHMRVGHGRLIPVSYRLMMQLPHHFQKNTQGGLDPFTNQDPACDRPA